MIGPEHLPEPSPSRARQPRVWRVAVVTGTRAEFGLLRPIMRAISREPGLELLVIAAGSHLIAPAETFREVRAQFRVADSIPMQIAGRVGRFEDAESVARGVGRFARSFERLRPDWVVVLGDRVEAFAAATTAAIAGLALAHVHGGDRAEGVADESMRHAISKLAHAHFPATPASGDRLVRMGEDPWRVHVVGSPAIDELAGIPAMDEAGYRELGEPSCVLLMHPVGRHSEVEEAHAANVLGALARERVLALHPNFDPGRDGIVRAIAQAGVAARTHLPREQFVGLLKRLSIQQGVRRGVLVGNSSAGLIEAAALGLPVVDVGARQNGRERCHNAVHCAGDTPEGVARALESARRIERGSVTHPYGDGRTGERVARLLASMDPQDAALRRKLCSY